MDRLCHQLLSARMQTELGARDSSDRFEQCLQKMSCTSKEELMGIGIESGARTIGRLQVALLKAMELAVVVDKG